MTLLERLEAHAFNLENTLAHDVEVALLREAHAALTAQAEEVALLREWYAADQEMDAAEAELRTPPSPGEIRSNGAFGQAQRRKWAAEEAIRAALKGASNEP